MGCLTAPFKLLGCLGLVAALAVGWLYRDRLADELAGLVGASVAARPATSRPARAPGALLSAEPRSTRSTAGEPIRWYSPRRRLPR